MRLLSGIATADLGLGLLLRSHLLLLNRLLCVNGLGRSLTECLHWLLDLIQRLMALYLMLCRLYLLDDLDWRLLNQLFDLVLASISGSS
jgi:hypothetical protein